MAVPIVIETDGVKFTQLPASGPATFADIACVVQASISAQQTLSQTFDLFISNTLFFFSGDPNGHLAGKTSQFCLNSQDNGLFACTASGDAETAVWSKIAANDPFAVTTFNADDGRAGHLAIWSGDQVITDLSPITLNSDGDIANIRNISIGGTSEFIGNINASNSLSLNGDAFIGGTLSTNKYFGDLAINTVGVITTGSWQSNAIQIAFGGTSAITQTDGFNNLSPLTTKGDIIVSNGTDNVRFPAGPNTYVISYDSSSPTGLAAIPQGGGGGGGVVSVGTSSDLTVDGTAGGTITASGTIGLHVTGVTAGTYDFSTNVYSMVVDNKGRITGITELMDGGDPLVPLIANNNLSDVPDKSAARSNMGLEITTTVSSPGDVIGADMEYLQILVGLATAQIFATTGFACKAGTPPGFPYIYLFREIEGTSGQVDVSFGNGEFGNPTISLPSTIYIGAIGSDVIGGTTVLSFTNNAVSLIAGNHIDIANVPTGQVPTISGAGVGINIDVGLQGKGAGIVRIKSSTGAEPAQLGLNDPTDTYRFALTAPASMAADVDFQFPGTLGPSATTFYNNGDGTTQWRAPVWLTGATMTGNLILNGNPTAPNQAANKAYVDSVAIGTEPHAAAIAASVVAYIGTYDNGASGVGATITSTANQIFVADGYTPIVNDRIVLKDQVDPAENGIYVVNDVGSLSTPWILERAADFDTDAVGNIQQNALIPISFGDTLRGSSWLMTAPGPFTVGTTAIVWDIFTPPLSLVGADGVTVVGNVISLTDVTSATIYDFPSSITINNKGQVLAAGANVTPLARDSNLLDVPNKSTARANMGLTIGTDVQAHSSILQALANNTSVVGGLISWNPGTQQMVYNTIASSNNTLQVTHGNALAAAPDIIIPNKTANTLAGYSNAGAFSDVTVGSGLTLSGGTLSLSSTYKTNVKIYSTTVDTNALYFTISDTSYPDLLNYNKLIFMFYNITTAAIAGATSLRMQTQQDSGGAWVDEQIIYSIAIPTFGQSPNVINGYFKIEGAKPPSVIAPAAFMSLPWECKIGLQTAASSGPQGGNGNLWSGFYTLPSVVGVPKQLKGYRFYLYNTLLASFAVGSTINVIGYN